MLVSAALNPEWSAQLNSTEQLLLVAMSVSALDTAKDDKTSNLYYGGHGRLMSVLCGSIPVRGEPEFESARKTVQRALKRLEDVGAIRCIMPAVARNEAVYQLMTREPPLPVDNSVRSHTRTPRRRDTNVPPNGTPMSH